MIEGEMYDGKIALIPCTEDYVTKRKSQFGPKGTLIQINKNVDAAFYTEMWREEDGGLDQIDQIAVDLSVSYEDYMACKDILARYNASSPI